MPESLVPLVAVVLGGLLTIAGSYASTVLIERQRFQREQKNLALAFRGEISAILQLIADRGYETRFAEIIDEIEKSNKPFYIPFRVRYQYDIVFRSNADKLGTLTEPLPELIAVFYTRMASILEDLVSLGDSTYASLPTKDILQIYRNLQTMMRGAVKSGQEIIDKTDELYGRHTVQIKQ